MSELINPVCRPPIWLFDFENKSVYLGLQHQSTKHHTLYPGSIPTIFTLPSSTSPNWFHHPVVRKKPTSMSKQKDIDIIKTCSQTSTGSAESRIQLTAHRRSQLLASPTSLTTYTSRYESWEHVATGRRTKRGARSMARELSEWEAQWRNLGGT